MKVILVAIGLSHQQEQVRGPVARHVTVRAEAVG